MDHPSDNESALFFIFHQRKFALFTTAWRANRNACLVGFNRRVIVNGKGISHSKAIREREREEMVFSIIFL